MTQQPEHDLILLGAGGHAAVVAEAAIAAGWNVLGCGDDGDSAPPAGLPLLGSIDDAIATARDRNAAVHLAVGDGELRQAWYERTRDIELAGIVHPRTTVSPSAQIADGVFVSAGVIINARADIQRCTIINTAAVVEHDCRVGGFSHIAPRAVLTGGATVGRQSLVGAGAIILPGRSIGENCTVGAGAVVVDDVQDGMTVTGVPARPLGIAVT